MLLVGSRALNKYIDIGRIMHDWDIWCSSQEYMDLTNGQYKILKQTGSGTLIEVDDQIIELKSYRMMTRNDARIFEKTNYAHTVDTPIGECQIPDIFTIYDMKKATAMCIDHHKHEYDQRLIEKHYPDCLHRESELYLERLKETKKRLQLHGKNKYDFFHRSAVEGERLSSIPEYIEHDYLHVVIADLLDLPIPTYQRFVTGDTEIEDKLWFDMTHQQRIDAMVEESLVLALERWFNPQMVENGINYRLLTMFESNNEAMPTYKLLYHCCVKGLKGEKEYITQFARDNFHEIEKNWIQAKEKIKEKGGLPKHYYDRLFKLRDDYRDGKKVGLHHKEHLL